MEGSSKRSLIKVELSESRSKETMNLPQLFRESREMCHLYLLELRFDVSYEEWRNYFNFVVSFRMLLKMLICC